MLIRYAVLGPVAFALVELPETGSVGTSLARSCRIEHHGIVVRGELRVVRGRTRRRFEADTAFHVPAGTPSHRLEAGAGTAIAGFVAVEPGFDSSPGALRAMGFDPVAKARQVPHMPRSIRLPETDGPIRRKGRFEVEASLMGSWLLLRSAFRPGDYSGGWCEVPHWGIVLEGAVAINYRSTVELLAAGDVFYAERGHQFETPDGASIVDYTPVDALDGSSRVATWRQPAIKSAGIARSSLRDAAGLDGDAQAEDGATERSEERATAAPESAMTGWQEPRSGSLQGTG
jgi:mannose-6-phosphate isomerase-like protein (cupin superfamily)